MKQIFVMCALLLGVCAANAQETDTVKYAAGNDLYRGITRKLPYRQMVTPYGVEVTFAKTVHIIFPSAVRYVDLGSNHIIAGKADGAENVIRVKATTEGFPGETNFSVICEDGSFYSFNAKYAREPEMLNIEMKDFLENEDTSDFSHTRMNIYFRELGNESPLLVKLIMQSIYKNNDRKVRHLGSKRFGIQFLIKGIYTYNGMLYVHTQTKNSSNVPFDTDFIKFKIVDKKVPKRTAIQETVLDAVRSYNEVIEIAGKSRSASDHTGGECRHRERRSDKRTENKVGNEETHLFYNDTLCAVPAFEPGTRAKIPSGHECLAGNGGHGGRGTLELRHGFCLSFRGGIQRLYQERQPLGDWRGIPA